MKRFSLALRWRPTAVVVVLAAAGMSGCAMHRDAPGATSQSAGSSTLPRMAPTQSTKATGEDPTANATTRQTTDNGMNTTAPTANQSTDGGSTLPRMAPTQSTKATGENPTANQ